MGEAIERVGVSQYGRIPHFNAQVDAHPYRESQNKRPPRLGLPRRSYGQPVARQSFFPLFDRAMGLRHFPLVYVFFKQQFPLAPETL